MKNFQYAIRGLGCIALLCFSSLSMADIVLQGSVGGSLPESSSYDDSQFINASVGYGFNDWDFLLGYIDLGEFELSNTNLDAKIKSDGPFLEVIKAFNTRLVDVELGVGLSQISSQAKLEGRKVGSSDDTVPFIELYIVKNFNTLFGIRGGISYFSDVAGNDITTVGFGIRFNIQ
jgi:hypothetical protein